jgi:short subunit dehydrogenase-like uncharacterized protein
MPGRIVLFGATGYTGRLTAEALVKRGAKPLLAGRSGGKLRDLAAELGGDLETATADVADRPSVAALVDPDDVMLSTVGPFVRWGGPAIEAAIAAGAHYLDSTGEAQFIREVFESYGPRAAKSGSALLTAFGYDWVPGNLAGALALEGAGEAATHLDIGYFVTGAGLGGMSGGTRASAAGVMLRRSPGATDESSCSAQASSSRSSICAGGNARRSRSAAPSTTRCRGFFRSYGTSAFIWVGSAARRARCRLDRRQWKARRRFPA